MKRLLRTITNYKVALASTLGILAGAGCLFFTGMAKPPWNDFLGGLGGTLVSVGLIGLLYETWLRRSIIVEYLAAANLSSDLADTGLREIRRFGEIDWGAFFEQNRGDVDIAVSYAYTWAGQHAAGVIGEAASHGGRVRVSLVDPDADGHLVPFYGETYGTDAEGLKRRISDAIAVWVEQAERSNRENRPVKLVIEGLSRHVPYTFYRSGDEMWIVLAPRERGRVPPHMPALRCRRTKSANDRGLYDWALRDIEACRAQGLTRVIREVGT